MTVAEPSTRPRAGALPKEPRSWAAFPAFMEVQFLVSRVSKESYNERKAVAGQTLTALGKWWGRKPLVLVRATILGLLLPATDDPHADRETFLALMTMDDEGMLRRFDGMPVAKVYEHCTPFERGEHFDLQGGRPKWKSATAAGERQRLQRLALLRMGYDERLRHCKRPEEIDGPSPEAWAKVNAHLGTSASSLPELVRELGERRFGHVPKVADAFCGGGSVPFEAARIGCEAYGSDLNPVAALLTWGALNIVGGGPEVVARVQAAQREVYEAVRRQVDEWGIERNEEGWTSDAYLYCNEVIDSMSGWRIPLAGSWVIAPKPRVIARLIPIDGEQCFDIEILEDASDEDLTEAEREGTWGDGLISPLDSSGRWLKPADRIKTGMPQLRGREGLRDWGPDDVTPHASDVFQERLYCIRWVDHDTGRRAYRAPTKMDLGRERLAEDLLSSLWVEWRSKGFLPTRPITPGVAINRPTRARGWTYWTQLFNPRQLLLAGLIARESARLVGTHESVAGLLLLARALDNSTRLSRWKAGQGGGIGGVIGTFYTPSLNTPFPNYGARTVETFGSVLNITLKAASVSSKTSTALMDARSVTYDADAWITDPGYSDAVEYNELSEFFLAWYEKRLPELFPDWYTDSKRALAVEGAGDDFRNAMVECYSNFTRLMPDDGFQVVMFTHTSADVWADLALIMWAAGLRVSGAWTIATETESAGIKQGNYVQGTVLLVLRKRLGERRGNMSDLYPDLQAEVQEQIGSMLALDDKEQPNFSDADYQLAAYAAAMRVLTAYSAIDEIDIGRELTRVRVRGEKSPLVALIERAVKIASDVLVPDGVDRALWRRLGPEERFYLKGVEVEAHGDYREGVYQEYARGYGVREYRPLLGSGAANQVRLKTPSEFKARDLGGEGFGGSLLRQVLFAVYKTAEAEDPRVGRDYLKMEVGGYWDQRQAIMALLRYLGEKPQPGDSMAHWAADAEAARLLHGSISNDST
jgi:adenine-specific DNA methylase